jgi:hypothetical protein
MKSLIEWLEFSSNDYNYYHYNRENCWENRVNVLLNGKVILANYTISEVIHYLQFKTNNKTLGSRL